MSVIKLVYLYATNKKTFMFRQLTISCTLILVVCVLIVVVFPSSTEQM